MQAFMILLTCCIALAAFGAQAVELVVADARGGALKAGQAIDGNQPLKLAAGERVTLIAADGRTIKLRGPYEDVPAPGAAAQGGNVLEALKNLTNQRAGGTGTLGVVRSGADADLPEPWLIDVSRAGPRCLAESRPVVLWRSDTGTEAALEIWPTDRSWQAKATWPAASDRLALPPSLPMRDRQGYIVTVEGATASITTHVVPATLPNDVVRVAWMLEKGCAAQAASLVRQLER